MKNETLWKLIADWSCTEGGGWADYNDDTTDDAEGILKKADKINSHIETLLQQEREKVVEEIIDFVQQESGKSGRKEIIEYLKSKKGEKK